MRKQHGRYFRAISDLNADRVLAAGNGDEDEDWEDEEEEEEKKGEEKEDEEEQPIWTTRDRDSR